MIRGAILAAAATCALSSGCVAASSNPPTNTAPSALLVSGEARGGWGAGDRDHGAAVVGVSASVGYRPGRCCAVDAYIGRSYFVHSRDQTTKAAPPKQDDELTDIGAGFSSSLPDLWDRLHFRLRGGLTAASPDGQYLMRRGVSGDAAILIRLSNPGTPVQVGAAVPRFDFILGGQAWALNQQRTTAGLQGPTETNFAITGGLLITLENGLDLH